MRRAAARSAVVLALLASTVMAPGAAALPGDQPPSLVFSGPGPTATTFVVTETTTLDLYKSVLSTAGRYGGVLVRSARGNAEFGLIWMRPLHNYPVPEVPGLIDRSPRLVTRGRHQVTLVPGTYHVVLLAEAATEVRVPLLAGRPRTVRTTVPKTQTLHLQEQPMPADADADVETVRLSVPFTRQATGWHSLLTGQHVADTYSEQVRVVDCISRSPTTCTNGGGQITADIRSAGQVVAGGSELGPERWTRGNWYGVVSASTTRSGPARVQLALLHVQL